MSEKVEQKKAALRDEFGFFEDPRDTFEYIIAKTKDKPHLPCELKKEEFSSKGAYRAYGSCPRTTQRRAYAVLRATPTP